MTVDSGIHFFDLSVVTDPLDQNARFWRCPACDQAFSNRRSVSDHVSEARDDVHVLHAVHDS